ncbi:succinylglutamate desuccinylase/aspartoacylase family protein [Herbaspirillum rubrisubalbicans]|uniref:succinylglutamate desuccinylase/aspartoacylase family protein n=1 Tax=Herbaspirillum rubrisubalbicans TaxID=80842 RepID=UPI00209DC487|nr:succinylglutamate desuccinylase/aspartoacylase family protein [Herbaspirillum rubrisubalbicans]MCP1576600.1 putative deacylase [Herbaspirillum rubrisubalbicans]
MKQASLITTDIDFQRQGFQRGTLRVPYSHDKSGYGAIMIPIALLSQGEGPTVLLTGGNHGDEYEGPIALMKLMQRLPEMQIRGRLIVIPALNFPAFLNGSRTSPIDKGNLNRVFPGQRNGTPTEMIAHYLNQELFPLADFVFDIHAGGASTNYLPTLMVTPPEDPARRDRYKTFVDAFAAPNVMIMDLLGEDRTYGAAMQKHKGFFFCGEFGGYASCNVDGLDVVESGLERLLHALDVTAEPGPAMPVTHSRLLKVEGEEHYVFAPLPGIFEPAFKLGDKVSAGQLAGRIFNPHAPWDVPVTLYFKGSGIVICVRTFAGVDSGDCLVHLASDTTWF